MDLRRMGDQVINFQDFDVLNKVICSIEWSVMELGL